MEGDICGKTYLLLKTCQDKKLHNDLTKPCEMCKELMTVFEFVSSGMKHSSLSALIQFQEFTMTLMQLRLNLTIADLAYRFAISTSTTCCHS